MSQAAVGQLLDDLRHALTTRTVRIDKFEERFKIMRPFEKRAAEISELPPIPLVDTASKIVSLLWSKTHPDRADIDSLIASLFDEDATVRAMAVTTLGAKMKGAQDDDIEFSAQYRVRFALEQQRLKESQPAVAFQFDQLIEQLRSLSTATPEPALPAAVPVLNPYVAGPPVRERSRFFGRSDVLGVLKKLLGGQDAVRSVVVQGGRRTGKTSLLYRLREGDLGDRFVPVYFDMQSVAGIHVDGFIRALAQTINETPGVQTPGEEPPAEAEQRSSETADFSMVRRAIRDLLGRAPDRAVVLMFDEYEVFDAYDADIGRQFQSLLEQEPNVFLLFAGAQKVEALESKACAILLDNARNVKVSVLSPPETRKLIVEPAQGILEFPEDVIARLQALTGGHPFYTQTMCQSLFDIVRNEGRRTVTTSDVEQAVTAFVDNPAPHLVLGWNMLELNEKVVASALGTIQTAPDHWISPRDIQVYLRQERFPVRIGSADIQEALSTLREQDWTVKRDAVRQFRLTMELVRRWIIEHRSIWELLEEQRRNVVERAAGFGRRSAALAIDTVVILLLFLLTPAEVGPSGLAVPPAYYIGSMLGLGRTPGMLLAKVRPVSEAGGPLHPRRRLLVGTLVSVPWTLAVLAFSSMVSAPVDSLVFAVAAGVLIVHGVMIWFGARKRGLFDKLTSAIFTEYEA